MAKVTSFVSLGYSDRGRRWRTEVECGYATFDLDGERYRHLETYGSSEREVPDKVSQSLEFDRRTAGELKALLERSFPGL